MKALKAATALLFLGMLIPLFTRAQHPITEDSIDVFIKNTMKQRSIPALQLAVIRDGKIVKQQTYGTANLEHNIPATDSTVFVINSITKAFVGVAIMQLVEDGKLKIDDPISLYLDSLPVSWQKITLQQLLAHTAGLPDIEDPMAPEFGMGDENIAWQKIKTLPLVSKPGEQFSYNQTGYVIIGKIITKLSGQHFTNFIEDRQFKIAGMTLTRFGDSFDAVPNNAGAYTMNKNVGGRWTRNNTPGVAYIQFPIYYRTAAGIMSTAKDMGNWIIALRDNKLLKNQASLEALWRPALLNNGKTGGFSSMLNGYALGWPTISRTEHPAVAPVGGGRNALFVYPKDNLSIVILTNLMGANPEGLVDKVAAYYIPDMHESTGFGLPPNIKKFRAELLKKGFDQSASVYHQLKKKDANFTLNEEELNGWAYQLLRQSEVEKALSIFKLNVALHPESANPYDSLGEIFEMMGNHKEAVINYKKSLSLDADNEHAEERIKVLSAH